MKTKVEVVNDSHMTHLEVSCLQITIQWLESWIIHICGVLQLIVVEVVMGHVALMPLYDCAFLHVAKANGYEQDRTEEAHIQISRVILELIFLIVIFFNFLTF